MNIACGVSSLRKAVVAGLAALTLTGAAASITPAEALPIAPPALAGSADASSGQGMLEAVHYRPYRHFHRWRPYHRFYGYRGYRRGVPLPCRGHRTAMSKRYC